MPASVFVGDTILSSLWFMAISVDIIFGLKYFGLNTNFLYINNFSTMAPRTKMASGSPHGGQQPSANVDDCSSDEEEYDDWEEYDGGEEQYEYPLLPRQFREERDSFNRVFTDDERLARDVPTEYFFDGRDDEEGDAPVRIFFPLT